MDYMLDPPDDEAPHDDLEDNNDKDTEYEIEAYLYDKDSEARYYDTLPGHGYSGSRR